jgi:hypothetical protein
MSTNIMMNLKDFYAKAVLLDDNQLMVIRYEITSHNIGKIQLSNSVKLLTKAHTNKLKKLLEYIEEYAVEYYYAPIHDTP